MPVLACYKYSAFDNAVDMQELIDKAAQQSTRGLAELYKSVKHTVQSASNS